MESLQAVHPDEAMRSTRSRFPFLPVVVALVLAAVAAYQAWRYYQTQSMQPEPVVTEPAVSQPAADPPAVAEAPTPVEAPAIENPIEPMEPTGPDAPPVALPALADANELVKAQLGTLLSRQDLLTFLQLDGFVEKAVATVDNLARPTAASRLWPVNPTPERFSTQVGSGGVEVINPANSQRYAPVVRLIESVDSAKAVGVYRTLYPLFQQAYEALGFPNAYFNDRLVEVIDHLIATPVPVEPPAVALVAVKGSVPSLRPWVRYEYVDPELEGLSAGRKILIRVGPENQRRLQAKLKDLRARVAKAP
ncbi:MAG: DUF3014 domain-containing protein [Burkholderiaceae bacterium]